MLGWQAARAPSSCVKRGKELEKWREELRSRVSPGNPCSFRWKSAWDTESVAALQPLWDVLEFSARASCIRDPEDEMSRLNVFRRRRASSSLMRSGRCAA